MRFWLASLWFGAASAAAASVSASAQSAASVSASAQSCPSVAEPVIDVHLHAYDRDPRFTARVPNLGTGAPNSATDGASHRAQTVAALRRLGIVRGIVGSNNHEAERAMVAAAPELLRLGYGVDVPTERDLAEIRGRHARGELAMIGEFSAQYEGVGPDDPRLEPLWALAEELQIPVAFHIGGGPSAAVAPRHRAALGDPLLIEPVLIRHPRLRLFLMHAGFPFADNVEALLRRYRNVHVDLGAIHWAEPRPAFHRYLRRLVEAGFADRIMFGSDQMVWPEAIEQSLQAYREADYLSAAQRRDILFNNAVRFFGWTDLADCAR